MSIFLAYDGSVNGDWIAAYALQAAAQRPEKKLTVLHLETTDISGQALAEKFAAIRHMASNLGIEVGIDIGPMRRGAFGGLVEMLPEGPETVVFCGLRTRPGRRGLLTGTVSEQLLKHQKYTVVALRVVQPGLLGVVRRLLLPVAGHRPGSITAHALLELLASSLQELRLLHVVRVGTLKFRQLSAEDAGALRHEAAAGLAALEREIVAGVDLEGARLDSAVRISDNWAGEALIEAGHMRADLMALEAPRSSLAGPLKFGDPVEKILRDAPCDVAIYHGLP